MVGDCKFWIGSSPYLSMPLDATFVEEKQLLFVADASRNECLCFNMASKQIKKLSYPGVSRPNSVFTQMNEIFVKDDYGIHKFAITEDVDGHSSCTYSNKVVGLEEVNCAGLSGLTDEKGNVYLLTVSVKDKLLYAIDAQHSVMTSTHLPITGGRSMQRMITCRPNLGYPNNNTNFSFYCSNIAENRISKCTVGFKSMNFVKESAKVESDFLISGKRRGGGGSNSSSSNRTKNAFTQTYPRYSQMAGLCFDNDKNLFTSDSKERTMYKFDADYQFEGRVNVVDHNGDKQMIRFGGLEFSPRYKSVNKVHNLIGLIRLIPYQISRIFCVIACLHFCRYNMFVATEVSKGDSKVHILKAIN